MEFEDIISMNRSILCEVGDIENRVEKLKEKVMNLRTKLNAMKELGLDKI